MERAIVHMDLDTFFVSCERLNNSQLNGLPIIIGGGDRGVVASCSYEARYFGVRSAMPMKLALRLCPDARVIRGDMEMYSRMSHKVTQVLEDKAPVVEKASIDEHYMDISGIDRFFGAYKWTKELMDYVTAETGLPVSYALSVNKTVAKIGTGQAKPSGQLEIPQERVKPFLNPLSIRKIPMLGDVTFRLLSRIGIRTIYTLSEMPVDVLQQMIGKNGIELWKKANGIDNTPVEPYTERKSVSTENTFGSDTIDLIMLRTVMNGMVEKLAFQLRKEGWLTSTVTVKVRYSTLIQKQSNAAYLTPQQTMPCLNVLWIFLISSITAVCGFVWSGFASQDWYAVIFRLICLKIQKIWWHSIRPWTGLKTVSGIPQLAGLLVSRHRPIPNSMYLNCHSFHSLRYGTLSLDELIEQAVACQIKTLALTDINTVTGIYDFTKACHKAGIKPIVGMEFRENNKLLYIALAKTGEGIAEMCAYLTRHNCDGVLLEAAAPAFAHCFVIYPMQNVPETLKENEFVGVRPQQLNHLVRPQWKPYLSKMLILQPVTFKSKTDFNLHRILRAIDLNVILTKLTEGDVCEQSEFMLPRNELLMCYKDHPQMITNTAFVVENCHFEFEFSTPKNKKYYTGSKKDDLSLLSSLAYDGLNKRYGDKHLPARQRVEKELKVIDELGFSGYFLITWDIVRYSNSMGFMHIGRGSGANSIVSYCLGITDICPIELDLYFERFLNLNRKTPPDFDIDWSWQERDVILNYIFNRYGKEHVAFCGTNVEFKYRSIIREVGKVFGLPKEELDALASSPEELKNSNSVVNLVSKYGKMLEKYPNQRSMHACGILISEEPITNYTTLEMPPKGFPIVQFDMHIAEEIGFEKFDILSQRGIGHINDSVKLIQKNRGITVNIRDTAISKDEKVCNEFLARGHTIGCFYIESPAMRGLLRRLKCDNYRTLVAASSIIRPGVAQSGMMKEYIFRHNNPDKFEYFHEVFKDQLGETYGIMVYQEDVIKIALHFGGLAAADGDILRRAMSGKGRSLSALQKVKDNFFASCAQKGHPEEISREVYRQIESFAGYSFCKAHSASYAVESYQSLYLKVYYPIEFMVAVINNQGGFYRTEVYVHEARMSGATILTPCVNKSENETTLYGKDVYLGFMHLQSLESKVVEALLTDRKQNGNYRSLEDFIRRVPIGIETLQILIFIGAFRFTAKSKNELLVTARVLLVNFKPADRGLRLLEEPAKEYKLPELQRSAFEDAFDEIELLSFPVSCSPFDLLQTRYRGSVMANELLNYHKKEVKMLAYLISRKHVPTKRGTMYFGTWVDVEGTYFDTAHFSDSLQAYPFQGGGCYLLLGKVEVDFSFPTITISKMAKMPFISDPRFAADEKRAFDVHRQIKEDVSMTHRKPYPQEHEIGLPRHRLKI